MTRRLVLGLQQALCRSLAEYQPAPHLASLTTCSACNLLPSLRDGVSAKAFASVATQPQPQQSLASDSQQQSSAGDLDTGLPLLQQAAVPEHQYSFVARTTSAYSVQRKPVFAVVELGPTQFKVTPDDIVYSERLKSVDVGDKVSLNRVLLLGNRETTVIGRPLVPNATVTAIIEVSSCYQSACMTQTGLKLKRKACEGCRSNSSMAKC